MKNFLLGTLALCSMLLCGEVLQKPVLKLLDVEHKKAPLENIVFSPFCIQECFGMVYCGAGKVSAVELNTVLGLNAKGCKTLRDVRKSWAGVEDARIFSINTLVIDRRLTLIPDFVNKAVYFYNGKVYKADFNRPAVCVKMLNEMIKTQSDGLFDQVFTERDFTPRPLAVLMNVLYFQSQWESPFDVNNTQKQLFHTSKDEKYQVDMMLGTKYVPYYNDGTLHAVFLPCKNPRFRMAFIMPVDPETPLTAVTEKLVAQGITGIAAKASDTHETVIQIPKVDISSDNDLIPVLRKAGMKHIFDPVSGDLDKMVKGIPLFIDQARQLIKLQIVESGTTMAAVTVVTTKKSAPGEKIINNFLADRPYAVILYDAETSAILLSGVICKPMVTGVANQQ